MLHLLSCVAHNVNDNSGVSEPLPSQMAFVGLLRAHLIRLGISDRDFAVKAGVNHTLLSRILAGKRPVDKELEPWARALGLKGEELATFLELGYLSRAHPSLARVIQGLREENRRLLSQIPAPVEGRSGPNPQ
ncbi:MAG: helix-turn-helix transcriptional regulator [Desulfovibrio sp.]|nr:helix-turn-helix transcriptional regulator [Desulfovibrio sp.]